MSEEAWWTLVCEVSGRASWAEVGDFVGSVGGPAQLLSIEPCVWAKLPGVSRAQAQKIGAAVALGAGLARAGVVAQGAMIRGSSDAFAAFSPALLGLDHEEFHVALLDIKHRLIGIRVLSSGSARFTVVDPAQIYRKALMAGASAIIVAHNHPSGDPTPSSQDREVTRRLQAAGQAIGIDLVDHLVIAGGRFVSAMEPGRTSAWSAVAACQEPGPAG